SGGAAALPQRRRLHRRRLSRDQVSRTGFGLPRLCATREVSAHTRYHAHPGSSRCSFGKSKRLTLTRCASASTVTLAARNTLDASVLSSRSSATCATTRGSLASRCAAAPRWTVSGSYSPWCTTSRSWPTTARQPESQSVPTSERLAPVISRKCHRAAIGCHRRTLRASRVQKLFLQPQRCAKRRVKSGAAFAQAKGVTLLTR